MSTESLDGVPDDYVFSDWQMVQGPNSSGVSVDLSSDGGLDIGHRPGTYEATINAQSPGSLALYFTLRIEVTEGSSDE